jgi:lysophospholipid acyltransferase (LPLAT)-like uncharacterized protein
MKIRKPWVIKSLCLVGYWLVRALLATVFCKYWRSGRDYSPANVGPKEKFIYVLWHEYLLVPIVRFHYSRVRLLVSQHSDGLIVAELCKHLRMGVVRGSKTRGGMLAVRRLLRRSRYRFLAVTPDGPQGPRRRVNAGVIFLAQKLGWPIIAIGVGLRGPWRLKTWDRLAIPRPFQPAAFVTSEPLFIPPNVNRDQLEMYRQKVEAMLTELTAFAERAAETGRRPGPLPDATSADAPPSAAA